MNKKTTHTGVLKGNDNRTARNCSFQVKLRETKIYWITEKGGKYKKKNGWGMGDWPLYSLDLNSIKKIEPSKD